MNKFKLLLIMVLVEVVFCRGQDEPRHDYFKLSLLWPNSFCLTSTPPCRRLVPQYFTINGLWPELFTGGGKQPINCSASQELSNDIIESKKIDLLKYWPDLSTYNFQDSVRLWKEQWKIHGSCASDVLSPEEYLVGALNLRLSHNLFDILALSEIRGDGRSYAAEDILNAISKVTRSMVNIVCKKDRLGNVYLVEIHQCIDNQAQQFIDCQDMAFNCYDDPIIFPDQKFIPRHPPPPPPPTSAHSNPPNCPKLPVASSVPT